MFDRIMAVCDPNWRTIVGLARYGGLRCPSEVLSLRWELVDWENDRMVVDSPKIRDEALPASDRG